MKIILSRKGFDSSNDGIPSTVFPSGKMTSLQTPVSNSPTTCNDIYADSRKINGTKHTTLNFEGRGQKFILDTKYYPDVKSWLIEQFS